LFHPQPQAEARRPLLSEGILKAMSDINVDSVGKYFTRDGNDVWRCVGYCFEPTVIFENIETKKRDWGAVSSRNAAAFTRIKGKYHKGLIIDSLYTLTEAIKDQRMFYWNDRVMHFAWVSNMSLHTLQMAMDKKRIRLAELNE
jgi:hypothetical protein